MSKLVKMLVSRSGLSEYDVRAIIASAPRRYKSFPIPKRNGDGMRIISQPAREVKVLQTILTEDIISHLPVHSAAKAYCQGLSIKDNAAAHVNNGPILKFDFAKFFPSLTATDWIIYCTKFMVFQDQEDIQLSANILFWRAAAGSRLKLAIGAPSSPSLSNVLMYEFDEKITAAVEQDHVIYTRYADDLTFSARRTGNLVRVEKTLKALLKTINSPKLSLNEDKTVLSTKRYRRVVTGLVLADDGKVSLGRDRKRTIRALVHHYSLGKLNPQEQLRLSGLLAFVNGVEPLFLERLRNAYGSAVIDQIRALPKRAATDR